MPVADLKDEILRLAQQPVGPEPLTPPAERPMLGEPTDTDALKTEILRLAAGPEPRGAARRALAGFGESVTGAPGKIAEGVGIATGSDALTQFGQSIAPTPDGVLPYVQPGEEGIAANVGRTLGSGATFAPLAALGGPLGIAAVSGSAAAQAIPDAFYGAKANGADDDTAWKAALVSGIGQGALETVLGPERLIGKIAGAMAKADRATGGLGRELLTSAVGEGVEEASQSLWADMVAQDLYKVEPDEDWATRLSKASEQAAYGALGGGVLGSVALAAERYARGEGLPLPAIKDAPTPYADKPDRTPPVYDPIERDLTPDEESALEKWKADRGATRVDVVERPDMTEATELARKAGLDVLFVDDDGKGAKEGVTFNRSTAIVPANADPATVGLAIATHEGVHGMPKSAREALRAALNSTVPVKVGKKTKEVKSATAVALEQAEKNYADRAEKEGVKLSKADLEEEATADLVAALAPVAQRVMRNPARAVALMNDKPGVMVKVLDFARKWAGKTTHAEMVAKELESLAEVQSALAKGMTGRQRVQAAGKIVEAFSKIGVAMKQPVKVKAKPKAETGMVPVGEVRDNLASGVQEKGAKSAAMNAEVARENETYRPSPITLGESQRFEGVSDEDLRARRDKAAEDQAYETDLALREAGFSDFDRAKYRKARNRAVVAQRALDMARNDAQASEARQEVQDAARRLKRYEDKLTPAQRERLRSTEDPEVYDRVLAAREAKAKGRFGSERALERAVPSTRYSLASDAGAQGDDVEAARKAWKEQGTESPWFRRWFGASKVVDGEGKPLVVYHGTGRDFTAFESKPGRHPSSVMGFFFHTDPKETAKFGRISPDGGETDPRTMPVYLSIQNPHDISWKEFQDRFVFIGSGVDRNRNTEALAREFRESLEANGFDGIRITGAANEAEVRKLIDRGGEFVEDQWIAFRPEQVKSALGNRGTFSPANPDIRYSLAYHGSPYEFDEFRSDKIGTGEGAQAYGHGLYFTGSKAVAEHYRRRLSRVPDAVHVDSKTLPDYMDRVVPRGARWRHEAVQDAISAVSDAVAEDASDIVGRATEILNLAFAQESFQSEEIRERYRGIRDMAIDAVQSVRGKPLNTKRAGKLYEVDLAPSDDEYLLHDEPLSKQPKVVRDFIRNELTGSAKDAETGGDLYREISSELGSDRAASSMMRAAGIRGIKYLDGNSRHMGGGTFNYVLFDDKDVKVLARYSLKSDIESVAADLSEPEGYQPAVASKEMPSRMVAKYVRAMNPVERKGVEEMMAEADAILADRGAREKLARRAMNHEALNEGEQIALQRIASLKATNAWRQGASMDNAVEAQFAFQQARTTAGRVLGNPALRDALQSPAERAMGLALTPSKQVARALKKAKTWQARRAIIEEEARKIERIRYSLAQKGFDPALIPDDYFKDPTFRNVWAESVADAKANGKWDWYIQWRRAAMLSGPITTIRNVTGNTSYVTYDRIARIWADAVIPGTGTSVEDARAYTRDLFAGIAQGWKDARAAYSAFYDASTEGTSLDEHATFRRGPIMVGLEAVGVRAQAAQDIFFRSVVGAAETRLRARQKARAEGGAAEDYMSDPDVLAMSKEDMERALFLDRDALTRSITGARDWLDEKARFPVGTTIVPFAATPTKIVQRGGETLLGPLGGYMRDREKWGGALLGAGAWAAMIWAASMFDDDDGLPLITGSRARGGQGDFQDRTAPAYSIRIGDEYYSYQTIEPLSTALAAIADAVQSEDPMKSVSSFAAAAKDKSFFRSIETVYDAIVGAANGERGSDRAKQVARDLLWTPMIPNIVRSPVRAVDDTRRKELGNPLEVEDFANAAFPSGDFGPPLRYDLWGRPAEKAGGSWVSRVLAPAMGTKDVEDVEKIDLLLADYNRKSDEDKFFSAPQVYVERNNVRRDWTEEEYSELTRDAGAAALSILRPWAASKTELTERDLKHISDVLSKTRARKVEEMLRRTP